MSLDSLYRLLPPPAATDPAFTSSDWERTESGLGILFAEDLKQAVARYGAGSINDFLWLLVPGEEPAHLSLVVQAKLRLDALVKLEKDFDTLCPYVLYPAETGILPWAITDNGDVLYGTCLNGTVTSPVVVGDSGGVEWKSFDVSFVGFLEDLLTSSITVDFFPEDFLSEAPRFSSWRQSS